MSRSIKHSCESSLAHHQLAALAITQVGMMRGFRSSEGFSHKVVLDEPETFNTPGEYIARPSGSHAVRIWTETAEGCLQEWMFTWPDLKLLGYQVVICEHTGFEVDPTMHDASIR